jgi:hypothetical protein
VEKTIAVAGSWWASLDERPFVNEGPIAVGICLRPMVTPKLRVSLSQPCRRGRHQPVAGRSEAVGQILGTQHPSCRIAS